VLSWYHCGHCLLPNLSPHHDTTDDDDDTETDVNVVKRDVIYVCCVTANNVTDQLINQSINQSINQLIHL